MAGFDYKQSYAWNEAIDLAQSVLTLIESFPETAAPLANQLANSAIQVPALVAESLVSSAKADLSAVLALSAEIELVNRIYPALDGAEAEKKLAALMERLQSPSFTELKPVDEPVAAENEEPDEVPAEALDSDDEETEPAAEATHINVQEA